MYWKGMFSISGVISALGFTYLAYALGLPGSWLAAALDFFQSAFDLSELPIAVWQRAFFSMAAVLGVGSVLLYFSGKNLSTARYGGTFALLLVLAALAGTASLWM